VKGQTLNVETFHGYGVMILKEVDPSVGEDIGWGEVGGEYTVGRRWEGYEKGGVIDINQLNPIK